MDNSRIKQNPYPSYHGNTTLFSPTTQQCEIMAALQLGAHPATFVDERLIKINNIQVDPIMDVCFYIDFGPRVLPEDYDREFDNHHQMNHFKHDRSWSSFLRITNEEVDTNFSSLLEKINLFITRIETKWLTHRKEKGKHSISRGYHIMTNKEESLEDFTLKIETI